MLRTQQAALSMSQPLLRWIRGNWCQRYYHIFHIVVIFYLDNMFRNNSFGRGSLPFLHIYMIWQAGSGVWVLGCPQVSKRWLREETDFGPRVNGSGTLYQEEEAGHWVKNKIRFWRQTTTTTGMKLNLQSNKMYQETRTKLNLVLKYIWYLRFKHSGL